jgi:topoisomerase-4 subunit A
MTLDDGDVPLMPRVVDAKAASLACLSEKGRLLVFGLDEVKVLSGGGRGVILMELEKAERLIAVQPLVQKHLTVIGTGRGGKMQEVGLSGAALTTHVGKRARKGKALEAKIKAVGLGSA